jgi:mannosyltransferase OCH1-like enzyme
VLPDYQVQEWNEANSPLAANSYTRAAYREKLWSRLSNYVRLHVLYREGGIYLDTDVEVIRSFNPLLAHKCFLGFQQQEEQTDWVNGAVLGAQAGHPFLKRCMELTEQLFEAEGEFYRSPAIITMALKEAGLNAYCQQEINDVTVYPAEYFYPYPWFGRFAPECITANTYSVHHWAGSWVKRERCKTLSPRQIMQRMKRALARTV